MARLPSSAADVRSASPAVTSSSRILRRSGPVPPAAAAAAGRRSAAGSPGLAASAGLRPAQARLGTGSCQKPQRASAGNGTPGGQQPPVGRMPGQVITECSARAEDADEPVPQPDRRAAPAAARRPGPAGPGRERQVGIGRCRHRPEQPGPRRQSAPPPSGAATRMTVRPRRRLSDVQPRARPTASCGTVPSPPHGQGARPAISARARAVSAKPMAASCPASVPRG